jgi:5-(carboxyamino)imidazole ribonucleotide synthase
MGSVFGKKCLGILGGGQLARMIAEAALREGLQPVVLAESRDVPAAIEKALWVPGRLCDKQAILTLARQVDVLTIENEFVDVEVLRAVLEEHPEVRLLPDLDSIAIAQDKLAQKQIFAHLGLASPDFECVAIEHIHEELPRLWRRFPEGFVLKFSRYGYDGRGNLVMKPDSVPRECEIAHFCRNAERAGSAIYAERHVDFRAELAIVAARAADGSMQCFPLVESRQERGICREVLGPTLRLGTAPEIARKASEAIERIANYLGFCGTLAVEFFLTEDGQLLINEMAPRVHNSGHYTLYGDEASQFDLHVQAVMGHSLATPEIQTLVAMRNILGPKGTISGLPCPPPTLPLPAGIELHWYGKRTVSAGRKMGHLTGRATSVESLQRTLEQMERYEAHLWAAFSGIQHAG